MPIFSQTSHPRLWLWFQQFIGGTRDKQQLILQLINSPARILEIGCSVGNIAEALKSIHDIQYTGMDIDRVAIDVAKARFVNQNRFRFTNKSLETLAGEGQVYDHILYGAMAHHIDDSTLLKLLQSSRKISTQNTKIILTDPEKLGPYAPLAHRLFYKLEQGQFLRTGKQLANIAVMAGLKIDDMWCTPIRPGIKGIPPLAQFVTIQASW